MPPLGGGAGAGVVLGAGCVVGVAVGGGAVELVAGAAVGAADADGAAGAGTVKLAVALMDGREVSTTTRWWSPGARP